MQLSKLANEIVKRGIRLESVKRVNVNHPAFYAKTEGRSIYLVTLVKDGLKSCLSVLAEQEPVTASDALMYALDQAETLGVNYEALRRMLKTQYKPLAEWVLAGMPEDTKKTLQPVKVAASDDGEGVDLPW